MSNYGSELLRRQFMGTVFTLCVLLSYGIAVS